MAASNEKFKIPPQITQSDPWLVMCGGENGEVQTFISLMEGRYYTKIIPELENKKIMSFCMEWLVLYDYGNKECTLLNVISMEKIELPKSRNNLYCFFCKLTSPPGDPQCHVVFIDHSPLRIFTCQPGDDEFIERKMELPEIGYACMTSATCFEGSIYGILSSSLSLIKANLKYPTIEFQIVINGESMQDELMDVTSWNYLTESCGELLMVTMSTLHEESWVSYVFRADFSTSKWVNLRSIGDRAIFLEPLSMQGISCASSQYGIQGNCIYYTREEDRSLYIFNLEDHSLTMIVPCPTLNPIGLIPHWLMITPSKVS